MTYLFTNNQEIKNDIGNPIPISKNTSTNTVSNPIHVTAQVTGNVNTIVSGASNASAFGEPYAITITPVIQLDSVYGITNEVIQTYTSNTTGAAASATPQQALFTVACGTSIGGYGVLRSKRFLRYRPGQGALCRLTAAFTPGVTGTSQRVGLANQENALQVGINTDPADNKPKFGVMRATGGKAQIVLLTINTAPTGTQTATVTLNGVAFNIVIHAGTTTATAVAINKADGFTGWLTDQVDNTIVFLANGLGPRSGTYSFSSTGTGTLATGTFSTITTGVAQTENWTYQSDFNVDKLDGTGPSGMTLAPEHLNVYQINFRWLGAGEIRYAIENQLTGEMVFFHREHYVNQNNTPHLAQPSFKIGYVAYNTGAGAAASSVTVTGASMMGAIEGTIFQNELNRSAHMAATTLASGSIHHLMTLRNPYVTNGKTGALNGNYLLNTKEIILKDISIGTQGNDPGVVHVFYEPSTFTGTHEFVSQPRDNGMVSYATGTFDDNVDSAVARFVTAINGEAQYPVDKFRIAIPPGSQVSIGIESSAQISRVACAVVFSED